MTLKRSQPARIMGILNVTPDSFSDGGQFTDPQRAVDHALKMVASGASILDLGAESTRPGSTGTAPAEQLARILPVLKILRSKTQIEISIDTQSAVVAEACLSEGADIINDISALYADPEMIRVLSQHKTCRVVVMHMLGTPATMQIAPAYADVVGDILRFFEERLSICERAGINRERIWIDPGFGFGKTFEHNLEIVRRFETFRVLKCPLVAGVSRKGFLGRLTSESTPSQRDAASIAAGLFLARKGADILRVHDVAGHTAALNVFDAFERLEGS